MPVLDGKLAVVAGGGRGLGRAMAIALAEAGADVAVGARSEAQLAEVVGEIKKHGRRAFAAPLDVTDEAQVKTFAKQVLLQLGRADILVNNAGMVVVKELVDLSLEEWHQVVETNLTGAFLCARAFGPHMLERKSGRVINIASVDGLGGSPHLTAYCASKGGMIQLTRALSAEWARRGVTVNAVAPGYFETDMSSAALADPATSERILRRIPLRRVGGPKELGPLVVYLASDASAFMTGEVLVIDGGQNAR